MLDGKRQSWVVNRESAIGNRQSAINFGQCKVVY
jgi:hypothetical protein